jgi:hypothetical protein
LSEGRFLPAFFLSSRGGRAAPKALRLVKSGREWENGAMGVILAKHLAASSANGAAFLSPVKTNLNPFRPKQGASTPRNRKNPIKTEGRLY